MKYLLAISFLLACGFAVFGSLPKKNTVLLPADTKPIIPEKRIKRPLLKGEVEFDIKVKDLRNANFSNIDDCALARAVKRKFKNSWVGPYSISIDFPDKLWINTYRLSATYGIGEFEEDVAEASHYYDGDVIIRRVYIENFKK